MTNVLEQQSPPVDPANNLNDTIVFRFDRQVAASPASLAIVTDETSLSYRALDLEANAVAAALASLPFNSNRPVVLFIKDDAARVCAMLGALKANRIFIPLAPNSPQEWLAQVVEDSRSTQILVDRSTRSTAELSKSVTLIEVEQLARSLQPLVGDWRVSSADTAAIVYTSGSTGRPKGVANSHRRLIRASDVRNRVAGIGRGDRYANLRSSGVSSWIRNTLSPILSGACLFPFDLHRHGLQKLASWLIAQKITYITFPGSLLRTWLSSLPDDLRFPDLRFVGATSERLYAEDVIRLSRHLEGDWRIGHSYSSTETGTIASQVFTPSRLPDAGIVPVGHPVDGAEVCIMDETGAPLSRGEIGEIVVRSRFLAEGYWNNPELTASVFQTDTFDKSIRTYRTGDLGRLRTDGTLELVARKGRRIRLRGYNIEPFQVERELLRQPGISDAIVLLHNGLAGEEPCLVGYVVAPASASPSAIRERLAERLPSYLVPSHIIILDSFPIASSGKVDRNALPPPRREAPHQPPLRAPSSDVEHELLEIWQDVLKIPKIEVDDDYFELGGTSLQALMVFAKIEARLGCSFSPTVLVQAPTVARLAEFIETNTNLAASQSLVPFRASGAGLPLFLVHGRDLLVMHYRHLVKELKSDRPVFGLQRAPLDGKHRVARTIESMAADCVAEIRQVQPHGPYFIAGGSFGGRLSFEVAQQLLRGGEGVSFLGMIDTSFHDTPDEASPWMPEVGRLTRRIQGVRNLLARPRFIRNALSMRLLDLGIRMGRAIPYERRLAYHDWVCVRATRDYELKPYAGHITMFSSAGNSERQRAHWEPFARGGLTVLEVPAGHGDMTFPPHNKLLAQYFDVCLAAAEHV
jgi:amino acid adenylation domain-containing protein